MSDTNGALPPRVLLVGADNYDAQAAEYLPDFAQLVPTRMTTIVAGEPGHGKSMLVCHIAAKEAKRGRIALIAAAEDSVEYTLKPRLLAEGLTRAQMKLVRFVLLEHEGEQSQLELPEHVPLLHDAIRKLVDMDQPPSVLLIDPIGSFMGRGIEIWKTSDVRAALGPFKQMAEEFDLAVILVAHISKGNGTNLANRLQDSSAYGQLARSILFLGLDPDDPEGHEGDQRVLASFKLSIGRRPPSSLYRIVPMLVEEGGHRFDTARIERVGVSYHTAHTLLAYSTNAVKHVERDSPKTDEATDWLRHVLYEEPMERKTVLDMADEKGITERVLREARLRLDVQVESNGGFPRTTTWRLP